MCISLALQRSCRLVQQSQLEGVTADEKAALLAEVWALASSYLPLIARRMDDNTMLPGRGTAVELAYKQFLQLMRAVFDKPPLAARLLQLNGLSLGYATAVEAARVVLGSLVTNTGLNAHGVNHAQAFVLRVVDSMQPAARSLTDCRLAEEISLTFHLQQALTGHFPELNAAFVASLHMKWTAASMVQMRRARDLLDASDTIKGALERDKACWRADVAKHGLKECALPSCGKREVSVGQHKRCSACLSMWYCSAEHGALHWKEHKPVCRATTASQHAAAGGSAGD